nr:MAG: nonstructural protein 1 [Parvoviridae sp.]
MDRQEYKLQAEAWLRERQVTKGFHFCFKIPDLKYKDKDGVQHLVTWRDMREPNWNENSTKYWGINLDDYHELSNSFKQSMLGQVEHEYVKHEIDAERILHTGVLCVLKKWCDWKNLKIDDVDLFTQSEVSMKNGYHVHVLWNDKDNIMTQKNAKWAQASWCTAWRMWLSDCMGKKEQNKYVNDVVHNSASTDDVDSWLTLQKYKHKKTKSMYAEEVTTGGMMVFYFLMKNPNGSTGKTYIQSMDRMHKIDQLQSFERQEIAKKLQKEWREDGNNLDENDGPPVATEMMIVTGVTKAVEEKKKEKTKRAASFEDTVQKAMKYGITDPDEYQCLFFDDYTEIVTAPGGEQKWKLMWQTVPKMVVRNYTAYSWLMQNRDNELEKMDPRKSKFGDIMIRNGYEPIVACHMISCWLNGKCGKLNTLLLSGGASTGKSLIAQSLSQAVGLFGNYNHSNENFPWSDCADKCLIWVEECPQLGKQVETFKMLMSGQHARVDQKGRGSIQLKGVPVIITSNNDITKVQIGAVSQPQHQKPLQDRCNKLCLNAHLGNEYGLMEQSDWGRMFDWLNSNGYNAELGCFIQCHKSSWGWKGLKGEQKSPKRARIEEEPSYEEVDRPTVKKQKEDKKEETKRQESEYQPSLTEEDLIYGTEEYNFNFDWEDSIREEELPPINQLEEDDMD